MHHLEIRSFMTGPEMLIRARACAGSAGAPSRFRFFQLPRRLMPPLPFSCIGTVAWLISLHSSE
jgi:hypothetical protein